MEMAFIGLGVISGGLFVAFLTLPRWLMRSLHRHRLWRFRDHVALEILDGVLPRQAASWALLTSIEGAIECDHRISVLRVWLFRPVYRRVSDEARQRVVRRFEPAMGTLTGAERRMILDRREHLLVLRAGSALLGSWIGLALVVTALPRVIPDVFAKIRATRDAQRVGERGRSRSVPRAEALGPAHAVVREATDTAAVRTRLGKAMLATLDEFAPIRKANGPQLVR